MNYELYLEKLNIVLLLTMNVAEYTSRQFGKPKFNLNYVFGENGQFSVAQNLTI